MSQYSATLDLGALDGADGFRIDGDGTDFVGISVSAAGDVNGDGFDDYLIGATGAEGYEGAAYLVFGSSATTPATVSLDALPTFEMVGAAVNDETGWIVSSA